MLERCRSASATAAAVGVGAGAGSSSSARTLAFPESTAEAKCVGVAVPGDLSSSVRVALERQTSGRSLVRARIASVTVPVADAEPLVIRPRTAPSHSHRAEHGGGGGGGGGGDNGVDVPGAVRTERKLDSDFAAAAASSVEPALLRAFADFVYSGCSRCGRRLFPDSNNVYLCPHCPLVSSDVTVAEPPVSQFFADFFVELVDCDAGAADDGGRRSRALHRLPVVRVQHEAAAQLLAGVSAAAIAAALAVAASASSPGESTSAAAEVIAAALRRLRR